MPTLEQEQRWDRNLPLEEQQRLAFARLLLHQPRWVLIDDGMGALDEEQRQLMLSIFDHELADAAVISIGRSPAHGGFFSRVLHFRRLSEGAAPIILFVLIIAAIAMAAPFLAGFENAIGIVIIGIGLYEAWKLNRRHVMTITGPHQLASAYAERAHG